MIIDGTDLEYTEADSVPLDFYLGAHSEEKESWALRVFSLCKEYKETDGKGFNISQYPKGMPKVYLRTAKDLWEEKKIRRRIAFMLEFSQKHPNKDELKFVQDIEDNEAKDLKIKWSNSHSDEAVKLLKSRSDYKTATQVHKEKEIASLASEEETKIKTIKDVEKLRSGGMKDELIKILYPASLNVI